MGDFYLWYNGVMKKEKLAIIKWSDSNMYITQADRDLDWKIAEIVSVGFIIREDKESIVLAGEIIDNDDVRRVIAIPKVNVLSRKICK